MSKQRHYSIRTRRVTFERRQTCLSTTPRLLHHFLMVIPGTRVGGPGSEVSVRRTRRDPSGDEVGPSIPVWGYVLCPRGRRKEGDLLWK